MAEQDDQDKPYITQPTTTVDLARRYAEEKDGKQVEVVNPTPYAVEDNDVSAYAGVSEEYATYADVRQQPFLAEDGPEAEAERRIRGAEAGLTTVLPTAEQTFTKPEKVVGSGVAPSAKAIGGLSEVGPMSLGETSNEPVAATVKPKFENSDFASGDKPEPVEQAGVTPVANTEPQASGTDTTEATPKKATAKP